MILDQTKWVFPDYVLILGLSFGFQACAKNTVYSVLCASQYANKRDPRYISSFGHKYEKIHEPD